MSTPLQAEPEDEAPALRSELTAGLLTALGCLLLGAPAGLLWAATSPQLTVVKSGGETSTTGGDASVFIAGDGAFLLVAAAAGLLTGLVAVVAGRRWPLGTALGLVAGGLLAADVARRTGTIVGREEAQAVLAAGADASAAVPVRLRAWQALVGWPVVATAVHMTVTGWRVLRAR